MEDLISTLNSTHKDSFDKDDAAKNGVLQAAKALVQRLEEPWANAWRLALLQPAEYMSLKIAKDLKLFSKLSKEPKSIDQLARATDCDPNLLSRVVRVLVTRQYIEEIGVDAYVATPHSVVLSDENGLINAVEIFYREYVVQAQRLPAYFESNGYNNPAEYDRAPWKWIFGDAEYPRTLWDWRKEQGGNEKVFADFFTSIRVSQPDWTSLYDVSRVVEGWKEGTPMLVDIGGGKGEDASQFAAIVAKTHPEARIVLQDRPLPLQQGRKEGIQHKNVEVVEYNFFDPQPVKGARVYFLHHVLHDWPDKEAREILLQVKKAMTPGYSRLLIMEMIAPERDKDTPLQVAAMDMQMMVNFSAGERKAGQWKSLLESAGLKYVRREPLDGRRLSENDNADDVDTDGQSMIEAVLEEHLVNGHTNGCTNGDVNGHA